MFLSQNYTPPIPHTKGITDVFTESILDKKLTIINKDASTIDGLTDEDEIGYLMIRAMRSGQYKRFEDAGMVGPQNSNFMFFFNLEFKNSFFLKFEFQKMFSIWNSNFGKKHISI